MTAPTPPRCACTHSSWRHIAGSGRCRARRCRCAAYRPTPAPPAGSRLLTDAREIATNSLATWLLAVALVGFAAAAIGAIR